MASFCCICIFVHLQFLLAIRGERPRRHCSFFDMGIRAGTPAHLVKGLKLFRLQRIPFGKPWVNIQKRLQQIIHPDIPHAFEEVGLEGGIALGEALDFFADTLAVARL